MSRKGFALGVTLFLLFPVDNSFAQHKKTNWLQEKKEYTARWRIGMGVDGMEPTGIDVQFYRLSRVCNTDFSITKKLSLGVYSGVEGLVMGKLIEKGNETWESGGFRYGIDVKFYFPIFLNPYIGFGAEAGTRKLNGVSDFSPDFIVRIGIEQKVAGIKLSSRSFLNITIFVDGKYNRSINEDFSYILPTCGIRFHFL